jgi:hypothetical protein
MISFTLATAVGVSATGDALGVVSIFGCTVVAIVLLLDEASVYQPLSGDLKHYLLDGLVTLGMQIVAEPSGG